ncbi:response regulator [Ideonella sp. YS5]|uniref:response regulator n=1 Tax=Ideonella sp. YS5 TaxID=3453714 RepID=UPI003EE886A5
MTSPIRLLVVDDHTLFRRGLIALLSLDGEALEVVGEAANASEAQRRAAELQPDLILLDNHLPGVRGIEALPDLQRAAPRAKVLMLTVSEDEDDLAAALKAGASGYVLKTIEGDALVEAIQRCVRGESVVSPELTTKLIGALRSASQPELVAPPVDPLSALSPREREIVQLVANGLSNKEIARSLDITEATVKIHVQHLLRKLNLKSRVQAAVFAAGCGVVG